jgi:hypothetical protein
MATILVVDDDAANRQSATTPPNVSFAKRFGGFLDAPDAVVGVSRPRES